MKLPPGYGQVIKLSGKRRRPYAVRITIGPEEQDGRFVRKEKYLEYFEKKADALNYLAKYNAGITIDKQPALTALPSFSDVFEGFMAFYASKHKNASRSTIDGYMAAYKNSFDIHEKKFQTIRTDDLQKVISNHSDMSRSTIANIMKLFHGMYKYAMMDEIVEKDYSQFVFYDYTESAKPAHTVFTDEEIHKLWEIEAYPVLIMLFTGIRVTEFLQIRTENIDLEKHIMIGGIKTKAGKNRIIPIHDAIMPLIRTDASYLWMKERVADSFRAGTWNDYMSVLGSSHKPHDTRHTAATLMERFGVPLHHQKLILGHSVDDVTQGVYTHISPAALVEDINRIPSFK